MSNSNKRLVLCEPLEERRLFVTYQVTGTNGPDTISISISGNSIISVVNGVSDSASDIINNEIEINALGGNDIISIVATGNNSVVILAGSGDDTINIGNGGNNLNIIAGAVTIIGGSGTDLTIFHDTANTNNATYNSFAGNQFGRAGMATATVDTENARVNASSGDDFFTISDPPIVDYLFNGMGGDNDIVVTGAPGESIVYRTGGQSGGSGLVDFANSTLEFFASPALRVNNMPSVTLRSSFQEDVFNVSTSSVLTAVSGVSGAGAAPPAVLYMTNVPICTIDLGTNDGVLGNDTLNFNGTSPHNTLFRVDMGGGTNVINVNANTNLDTRVGPAGGQFTDIAVNGNATAIFEGLQTPKSLILRNTATARFNGSGVVLSTQALNVPVGNPTLRIDTGQTGSVQTSFAISAGQVLNKSGAGTFNVNAAQTHGANAMFSNNGGTTNFATDCGSTTSRPLDVFANSGTINLNATQHVDSIATNFGSINVGTNGNRVVVTNLVSISGEGGSINLNNNDMIVDYTNASELTEIRTLLRNGRANGAWNGMGINSAVAAASVIKNTTLGGMPSTDFFSLYGSGAPFAGQTIDNTAFLIKFTYYGDANFSGTVNFDDYARTDSGFLAQRTGWVNGDFDDDGDVDFDDYALIDRGFLTQGAPQRPANGSGTGESKPGRLGLLI